MTRLALIIVVVLFLATLVDWFTSESSSVRTFGKTAWFFILLVPMVGPLLWLFAGRPALNRGEPRGLAPDDDTNFLNNLRIDQELRKKDEEE